MKPILIAGGQGDGRAQLGIKNPWRRCCFLLVRSCLALPPVTAISVARQACEESQRNGRQGS
jgi:hypothetical protein